MSCHCPQEVVTNNDLSLLLTILFTGISSSFTHCIGMCGPFAINQMTMRMMSQSKENLNSWTNLKCSLAMPYYLGKAITYACLAAIAYFIGSKFLSYDDILWPRNIFLWFISGIFILSGLQGLFKVMKINSSSKRKIRKTCDSSNGNILKKILVILPFKILLLKVTQKINFQPFGIRGIIMGMILGLIPCGLVYSVIVMVVAGSGDSIVMVMTYMFIFGLTTIPGLFIISYFGQHILINFRRYFHLLYGISMLVNSYIVISLTI